MEVLHIINSLEMGGAETLLLNILKNNNNDNINLSLMVLNNSNNVYNLDEFKDINIYEGNPKLYSLNNIKQIKHVLKNNHFDIVHVHLFPSMYFAAFAKKHSKNKNVKLVFTEHSTTNNRMKKIFRPLENFVYKKYDKIITISDGVYNSFNKWLYKKNRNKLTIINNGINLEHFATAKKIEKYEINSSFKKDDILILMAARFTSLKDQPTLIKALSLLPDKYKLLLAGTGELKEDLLKLVDDLKLNDRVVFLGFRNDIATLNKSVDLIVLSSKFEGFGLSALEGMAAGKIVLGTNIPGLKEVIGKEENLFEVGNFKQLANKIISIKDLNDVNNKEQINKFDIKLMIKKYNDLYEELVNGK